MVEALVARLDAAKESIYLYAMRHTRFMREALARGWQRLRRPAEILSLLIGILAMFGLPTTIGFLPDSGVVDLALGFLLVGAVLLFEGGFQLWHEAQHDNEQAAALRETSEGWREELTHFLEVRSVARPVIEEGVGRTKEIFARRMAGLESLPPPPRDEEGRRLAAAHDRETVGLYLERFAGPGAALFDAFVRRESLVGGENDREKVRSPRNFAQIDDAARLIQAGEWADLRWKRS